MFKKLTVLALCALAISGCRVNPKKTPAASQPASTAPAEKPDGAAEQEAKNPADSANMPPIVVLESKPLATVTETPEGNNEGQNPMDLYVQADEKRVLRTGALQQEFTYKPTEDTQLGLALSWGFMGCNVESTEAKLPFIEAEMEVVDVTEGKTILDWKGQNALTGSKTDGNQPYHDFKKDHEYSFRLRTNVDPAWQCQGAAADLTVTPKAP